MNQHSQNQRERLNFLEFRVFFSGQVSRSDVTRRFGISEAAATRDLSVYRAEAPRNLNFDSSLKVYRISESFELHFLRDVDSKRLLQALIQGIGDDFGTTPNSIIPCELPALGHVPSAEIIGAVTRAIYQKRALQIEYFSGTGNHGLREIVPFSLVSTGMKWMVRAFCRRKGTFSDFVLNRVKSANVLWDVLPNDEEGREHDDEWNRVLKLEIVPHPATSPQAKAMVQQELQMSEGALVLRVRAAVAGYILRLWSVDCSEKCNMELPLALKNLVVLHDVESAILAPGYSKNES